MSYDLLIKNGTVVDGTGAPSYRADVAVADGKIAAIGKIRDGAKKVIDAADLAIFDLNTVGSKKRGEMRTDLPGGGRRLVMPAEGVQHTVVNGTVLYEDKQHTGALPGQVLRSGRA